MPDKRLWFGTMVVAILLVQGCVLLGLVGGCEDAIDYAITVRVLDSSTGEGPGASPVGILTDGTYVETMLVSGGYLAGGQGRPGTYDVEIRVPGYTLWRADGIVAKPDECSKVDGIELTAYVIPVASTE